MKLTFINSTDLTVEGTPEEVCQFLALHEKRMQPAEQEKDLPEDLPPWAYVPWFNWETVPDMIRAYIYANNGNFNVEDMVVKTNNTVNCTTRSAVRRIIEQHCKILNNRVFLADKGRALLDKAFQLEAFNQ
jgi:hypothetical protein